MSASTTAPEVTYQDRKLIDQALTWLMQNTSSPEQQIQGFSQSQIISLRNRLSSSGLITSQSAGNTQLEGTQDDLRCVYVSLDQLGNSPVFAGQNHPFNVSQINTLKNKIGEHVPKAHTASQQQGGKGAS